MGTPVRAPRAAAVPLLKSNYGRAERRVPSEKRPFSMVRLRARCCGSRRGVRTDRPCGCRSGEPCAIGLKSAMRWRGFLPRLWLRWSRGRASRRDMRFPRRAEEEGLDPHATRVEALGWRGHQSSRSSSSTRRRRRSSSARMMPMVGRNTPTASSTSSMPSSLVGRVLRASARTSPGDPRCVKARLRLTPGVGLGPALLDLASIARTCVRRPAHALSSCLPHQPTRTHGRPLPDEASLRAELLVDRHRGREDSARRVLSCAVGSGWVDLAAGSAP